MNLILPKNYVPTLVPAMMEQAIEFLKDVFQHNLATSLNLRRVTAPLFVLSGTGINDDLSGTERAVSFPIKSLGDKRAEVVHSLAKWKRIKLGEYKIAPGFGIYTDMNAIRADEELDNIHSLYVDQWDWERTITTEERSVDFLKEIVEKTYSSIRETELETFRHYPHISPILPEKIRFIHAEDLLLRYPKLTPRERENEFTKEFGAVFIIGIGGKLSNGEKHDNRAPDYDDWSTQTFSVNDSKAPNRDTNYRGLNGDILLWNPMLNQSLEISSMGIRVDKTALLEQLRLENCIERKELMFHKMLLDDDIPLAIGGGIGQSRLCMFFLRCAHIGEVQASIWSPEMIETCAKNGVILR